MATQKETIIHIEAVLEGYRQSVLRKLERTYGKADSRTGSEHLGMRIRALADKERVTDPLEQIFDDLRLEAMRDYQISELG